MTSNLVKGTNWAEEELTALLLMWAEAEVQADLNGITRNKPIFDKLADRLVRECKFPRRTGQSCRDKINRIKSLYTAESNIRYEYDLQPPYLLIKC